MAILGPTNIGGDGVLSGVYTYRKEVLFTSNYTYYESWTKGLAVVGGSGPLSILAKVSISGGAFIGPKTSKRIAAEFAKHEPAAQAYGKSIRHVTVDWFKTYKTIAKMFKMAAENNGVVAFH